MVAGGYPEEDGASYSPEAGSRSKAKDTSEGAAATEGEEPPNIKYA